MVQRGARVPVQLKPALTGRPLPWPLQNTVHSTSRPPPTSLVRYIFKPTVWNLESYRGLGTS